MKFHAFTLFLVAALCFAHSTPVHSSPASIRASLARILTAIADPNANVTSIAASIVGLNLNPAQNPAQNTPTGRSSSLACRDASALPARRQLITDLNRVTRTRMTRLGSESGQLRPLATNIQLGVGFSVLNNRGLGMYNYGKTVTAAGKDIKLLAHSLIAMVDEWEQLQFNFTERRASACGDQTPADQVIVPRVAGAAVNGSAAQVTTVVPEASTAAPVSSSLAPEAPTAAPVSSSVIPEVSTAAANAEPSSDLPEVITVDPETFTVAPEISNVITI